MKKFHAVFFKIFDIFQVFRVKFFFDDTFLPAVDKIFFSLICEYEKDSILKKKIMEKKVNSSFLALRY